MNTRAAAGAMVAAVVLTAALSSGCSDPDPAPSTSDLAAALQSSGGLAPDVAQCVAERIHGELDDATLRAVADDDDRDLSAEERERATRALADAAEVCAEQAPTTEPEAELDAGG